MIAFTSLSGLFGNLLVMISGLMVARWLLPEELGFFNAFTVITSYIVLIQVGIPSGLSRELPYYLGQGKYQDAEEFASVANFWGQLLGSLVLIICIVVAIYYLLLKKNLEFAAGISVIGITSFQGLYIAKYLKVLYRSNVDFNKLALIQSLTSIVSFISIYLVWKFSFYGLCLRSTIIAATDFCLTYYWRPIKVQPKWNKSRFKELLRIGMPIYSVAMIYGLWPTFQRTSILILGGKEALGLYALAVMVEGTLQTLTSSISSVSFPKMSFAYGKGANFVDLMKIPSKFVALCLILFSFISFVGWFALPPLVKFLLPNYIEGIETAQWMLLVGAVSVLSIFSNVYMVLKRNFDRLIAYVVGMLVWAVYIFVSFKISGFSLVIFAKGLLIGYIATLMIDGLFYLKYYKQESTKSV